MGHGCRVGSLAQTVRFVMESGSESSQVRLVRDVPVRCDPARISGRGLMGEAPARRVAACDSDSPVDGQHRSGSSSATGTAL